MSLLPPALVLPFTAFKNLFPNILKKKISHALISPDTASEYYLGGEIEDEMDLLACIPPHDSINPINVSFAYTPESDTPHKGSYIHLEVERHGAGWADVSCRLDAPFSGGTPTAAPLLGMAGKVFPRSAYDGDILALSGQETETPLYLFAITQIDIYGKDEPPYIYAPAFYNTRPYIIFQQLANSAFYTDHEIDPQLEAMVSTTSYHQAFDLKLKQQPPTRAALLEAFG